MFFDTPVYFVFLAIVVTAYWRLGRAAQRGPGSADAGHGRSDGQPPAVKRKPPTRDAVIRIVQPRMEKRKALADAHGTEIALLLPPIQNPDDGGPSGAIPAAFYRDGLHLNAKGAALFTDRLIEPLKSELASSLAEREGTHREPTE